jgi:hypothetical protein
MDKPGGRPKTEWTARLGAPRKGSYGSILIPVRLDNDPERVVLAQVHLSRLDVLITQLTRLAEELEHDKRVRALRSGRK